MKNRATKLLLLLPLLLLLRAFWPLLATYAHTHTRKFTFFSRPTNPKNKSNSTGEKKAPPSAKSAAAINCALEQSGAVLVWRVERHLALGELRVREGEVVTSKSITQS